MSEGSRKIDRIMRPIVSLDPPEYNRIYEVVDVLLQNKAELLARNLVKVIAGLKRPIFDPDRELRWKSLLGDGESR